MASQSSLQTLSQCANLLKNEMGEQSPALVTLKRWSAEGLLDDAKTIPQNGVRAKYNYRSVLRLAKKQSAKRASNKPSPTPVAVEAAPTNALYQAFLHRLDEQASQQKQAPQTSVVSHPELVQAITQELKPLIEQAVLQSQKQMENGLVNLDHIRKSLMLRYDSENSALRLKVDELTQFRRKEDASTLDLSKMNQRLATLADKLNEMSSQVSELKSTIELLIKR